VALVAISSAIFLIVLIAILLECGDRAIIAIAGAAVMVGLGTLMGFYSERQAMASIDLQTLGLLLAMMILVALLRPTGLLEALAAWTARLSGGKPALLLVMLGTVTALLSMLLPNVTVIVLVAPLTILVAEVLAISPIPLLIGEAILSNVGGVGTLIGDPPNMLIGSAAGLSFNDFLLHALPVSLVTIPLICLLLLFLYRRGLKSSGRGSQALDGLRPAEALHDRKTAYRVVLVLACGMVLLLFEDALGLTSSLIALSMAAAALVWVQPPMDELLKRIDWQVLIFFLALFVVVGGLESAGTLALVASRLAGPLQGNSVLAAVGVLWLTAVTSAVVDNVPITAAMIPVIFSMGEQGIDIRPLWWALALGAGFGGNGTIIGSASGIIVAEISARTPEAITSRTWLRVGPLALLVSCVVATLALVIAYPFFTR